MTAYIIRRQSKWEKEKETPTYVHKNDTQLAHRTPLCTKHSNSPAPIRAIRAVALFYLTMRWFVIYSCSSTNRNRKYENNHAHIQTTLQTTTNALQNELEVEYLKKKSSCLYGIYFYVSDSGVANITMAACDRSRG